MNAYRTEQVDTPAGVYTVELHFDADSENPLTSWDQPGMAFYIVESRYDTSSLDTLDDAGHAGDILRELFSKYEYSVGIDVDGVERRFAKWRAIAGSTWVLVTGEDSASRSDYYRWYVLVDSDNGSEDYHYSDPVSVARAVMHDYRTWARGEVCGFVTKAPDGEVVESVWGFYDDDDAISEGRLYAESDALNRIAAGNLAGAGFVGII